MDILKSKESVKLFVLNIPNTLKKTFIWILISYIIPIINIAIIWGIEKNHFSINLNILSIILVTNACFVTSLIHLINKRREFITTLNIIIFAITIVLFSFSIAQIELNIDIFSLPIYRLGAFVTLGFSILFGLISKYDEVEAEGKARANAAKNVKFTTVDGKTINL